MSIPTTPSKETGYEKMMRLANQQVRVGRKDDLGKLRFDLVPAEALEEIVRIYTYGSQKYDDRNWEKGIKWSRVFAAMMRHLWAFWRGETLDPESGMPHMAHAAWGCFTLLEYARTHPELDDRPNKEAALVHYQCDVCKQEGWVKPFGIHYCSGKRARMMERPPLDVRIATNEGGHELKQKRGKERLCPQCGESEFDLYKLVSCDACGYPRLIRHRVCPTWPMLRGVALPSGSLGGMEE